MVSGLQESIDTPCPNVDPPPHVQKKHNMKLSVVAEEAICPGAIAEERFLHNHEECFKAQTLSILMDLNLGVLLPAQNLHRQPGSPPMYLDLEEMHENELPWLFDELDSSPPFSPESPSFHAVSSLYWEGSDFQLKSTP